MAARKEHHPSKQVFINNLDKYTSKYIGKFLSSSVSSHVTEPLQDERTSCQEDIYHVVGTVSGETEDKSSFALEEYTNITREDLFRHLMRADVIVYNIYNEHSDQIEEASWAASALHGEIAAFPGPKTFILITSVMTWALTQTLDPNDPEIHLTEWDYRRRKPHPNFEDHIAVEKLVVKLGKSDQSQFSTYVVASGLQYGMGEQAFHFFFKTSWLGDTPEVPIFGDGANIVPAVHVNDLAGIVKNVIDRKPKPQYFLAVDESQNSIADIITAIASTLGPGKMKHVVKEDVFLTEELTQPEIDHLFVNLRMEAIFFDKNFHKENLSINWVSKNGIIENINRILEEYKLTRGLLPLRICLLGPPAVGKSTVAENICEKYKLHRVKLKETISEALTNLESRVRVVETESTPEDGSRGAQELLETLRKNMDKNGGWLDQPYVIQMMKDKLQTTACRNQGFVLDGFPETYDQAKELFCVKINQADDEWLRNKGIIPEFVLFLDGTDEFLEERVLNLPESVVQGTTHCVEKYFQRLEVFRKNNTEEKTVLKYFDELEIHAERLETNDLDNVLVMEKVIEIVGPARNYGSTAKDTEEQRKQMEIRLREKEAAGQDEARRKMEEEQQRSREQEEWNRCVEDERRQEEALLRSESTPFRRYLINSVLPSVIRGCLEICELRPEDPIHYLAEYLRKQATKSAKNDELQPDLTS